MIATSSLQVPERFHPRVETNLTVKVLTHGRAHAARAKDLSMAGLYLIGDYGGQDRITVAIPLPRDKEIVSVCRVKRRHADGVGLEFEGLDWEDLFALARFMHPRLP